MSESAEFVRACAVSDLKDGGAISVVVGGDEIAIVKTEGEVFAIREFRGLWFAQVLSYAGDQFAQVAIAVLVYHRTGSALLTVNGSRNSPSSRSSVRPALAATSISSALSTRTS